MSANNVIDARKRFRAATAFNPADPYSFDPADPYFIAFSESKDTLAKRTGQPLDLHMNHVREWEEALKKGNAKELLADLHMRLGRLPARARP